MIPQVSNPLLPELTPHERRVKEMMMAFGQATPDRPTIPDLKTRLLRVRLLLEEVFEFAEASAVSVTFTAKATPETRAAIEQGKADYNVEFEGMSFADNPNRKPDLVAMLDGLSDISVVNVGAFVACGVRMSPCLEAVDANNLAKVARGREDPDTGKFIKPPDHQPPNLELTLALQGYQKPE